jgi:hypothetical protein
VSAVGTTTSKTTRPSHSSKNNPHRRIAAEHLRHNVCSRGHLCPPLLPCAHYVTYSKKRLAPPASGRDSFWGWRSWWLLWLVGLDGRIYDRHASTLCHSATDSGLQQPSCNPILMKKWSRVDGITLLQTGFAECPHTEQVANWKFDRLQAFLVQPRHRPLTSEEVR